jgi:hypothetical protein
LFLIVSLSLVQVLQQTESEIKIDGQFKDRVTHLHHDMTAPDPVDTADPTAGCRRGLSVWLLFS